jgi:hypothetical protein
MSDTITRRSVAHAAREHAKQAGITEGHGKRGRVAKPVVLAYLAAEKPATVREIGTALGVEVPAKGRPSASVTEQIALVVTKNAPKSE